VKLIGRGTYGNVFLALNGEEKVALKCIKKQQGKEGYHAQFLVQREVSILKRISHVFIQKFLGVYEDDNNYYLFTELVNGSDLFHFQLQMKFTMEILESKLYIAQIILILEYLHSKHIIYRDLKPENIMICLDGYLKLIDFGAAKHLKKDKTRTVMGSLHYLAPEVLDGSGHSFPADIFSLGVLFYEMICGSLPFGNGLEDPQEIYKEILKKHVKFHPAIKDKQVKKLIRRMLHKSKNKRAKMTAIRIKKDPVFGDFIWVHLSFSHL